MRIRKIINRRLTRRADGVSVAAAVNAAVVANVNEPEAGATRASARQRIVQRDGETVVSESVTEATEQEPDRETEDRQRRSK